MGQKFIALCCSLELQGADPVDLSGGDVFGLYEGVDSLKVEENGEIAVEAGGVFVNVFEDNGLDIGETVGVWCVAMLVDRQDWLRG